MQERKAQFEMMKGAFDHMATLRQQEQGHRQALGHTEDKHQQALRHAEDKAITEVAALRTKQAAKPQGTK